MEEIVIPQLTSTVVSSVDFVNSVFDMMKYPGVLGTINSGKWIRCNGADELASR